jgi:hypothetical protein
MRERMRLAFVAFLGSIGCLASVTWASTTYSYFYIAGQTDYTGITPGGTVNVPVYLQEVNSDESGNSLIGADDGLFSAGINASFFSSSGGNAAIFTGVTPNSGSPTTGFDDIEDQSYTDTSANILEQLSFSDNDGVTATSLGSGVFTVYLGNLAVQGSSDPGQKTTFTVGAYDPNNGNTVTFNDNDTYTGYDLDNNMDPLNPGDGTSLYSDAAPTNFSITTIVPEPGTLSLLAIGGLLVLRRRRGAD